MSVFARRYSATGLAEGLAFQVNTYTTNSQSYPVVAADAGGNFMVVRRGSFNQDGSNYGVVG